MTPHTTNTLKMNLATKTMSLNRPSKEKEVTFMAKENKVIINGQISGYSDEKEMFGQEYRRKIRIRIRTLRPQLDVFKGENSPEYVPENITVFFRDEEQIWELSQMKPSVGDMMEVYGTLITRPYFYRTPCTSMEEDIPKDDNVIYVQGVMTVVRPLFFRVTERREESGYEDIKTHKDEIEEWGRNLTLDRIAISNSIHIIGNLCADPHPLFTSDRGVDICTYQIATSRSIYIPEEPPAQDTDFPWVRSFGEDAVKDSEILKRGSLVHIDGFLQARFNYEQYINCRDLEFMCPFYKKSTDFVPDNAPCGKKFIHKNQNGVLEIVPYEIDRIRGSFKAGA